MNSKSILYCVLAFLLGTVFLYMGFNSMKENSQFREKGQRAMFTPATNEYTEHRKRRGGGVYYTVSLNYTTAEGTPVTVNNISISTNELDKLKAGEDIECLYLPNDPKRVRCQDGSEATLWQSFLTALAAYGFIVMTVLKARRENQYEDYDEDEDDDDDTDDRRRRDDGVRVM